jgi:hypothetical protein
VDAVIIKLQDVTSDGGVQWDSRDSLVTLLYPDSYTGEQAWLNFKGNWGNRGTTDCWWHFIHPECKLDDGPPGPVRDDVLSVASVASVDSVDSVDSVASVETGDPGTAETVASKYRMTGPLSVRNHHPPCSPVC